MWWKYKERGVGGGGGGRLLPMTAYFPIGRYMKDVPFPPKSVILKAKEVGARDRASPYKTLFSSPLPSTPGNGH